MFLDANTPDEPPISIWTSHEFPTIRGTLNGANPSGVTQVDRIDKDGNFVRTIWMKSVAASDIENKKMRIMPLGGKLLLRHSVDSAYEDLDSITVGYPGNPSNGYRKRLRDLLNVNGNTINYVGSQISGDFPDPRHEGQSGAKIAGISANADNTLSQRPNIILLHAGTNDMGSDADASGASGRLANLIDKLVSKCPDAAILVARIIHSSGSDAGRVARTESFNNEVSGIVQSRRSGGKHVYLVDQYAAITSSDLQDGLHPSAAGYSEMGDVWNQALRQVNNLGWINDPVPGTGGPGTKQKCSGKLFWYGVGQIANGAGLGKGFYTGRKCVD